MVKVKSDMVKKLRPLVQNKRVGVFIDAANLYYSASKQGMYVSFESISDWFRKHSGELILNFYTAFDPDDVKQGQFLDRLDNLGYRVIKKPIKKFNNMTKGNMDIELAVDAFLRRDEYDVFVLISGDGDFSYLVKNLNEIDKDTMVIGVGGYTSFELHEESANYFFLDRIANVWRQKAQTKSSEYKIFVDDKEVPMRTTAKFSAPQKEARKIPKVKLKLKPGKWPQIHVE